MKKLSLNKQIIAKLEEPNKIFGGQRESWGPNPVPTQPDIWVSCRSCEFIGQKDSMDYCFANC